VKLVEDLFLLMQCASIKTKIGEQSTMVVTMNKFLNEKDYLVHELCIGG